jgi:hypothetical protein
MFGEKQNRKGSIRISAQRKPWAGVTDILILAGERALSC